MKVARFLGKSLEIKAWPQHLPVQLNFSPYLSPPLRGKSQLTDSHCSQNLSTTTNWPMWEITHGWGVGGLLSQWSHCMPPTLSTCTAGDSRRERGNITEEERRSGGLVWSDGAQPIGGRRTQRANERPLVIWSVRQLGLSSETRRGEVGDHVWGPPQLLLALIFNRCLRSQPAKSSHMPGQENQSKDPAAGWAPRDTHTHTHTHTHTAVRGCTHSDDHMH